jgi:uncharacterized lipoprotein YddW (UPF0748 family)
LAAGLLLALAASARAELTEYRSIFVDRFDFPFQSPDVPAMTATIESMIQKAADEGFTEVVWQVRARGDALYNGNIEPAAFGLTPGFDPLQVALDATHAHGMKFHAWLNSTPMWNHATLAPPPGHIFHNTDPSFRIQNLDGTLEPQQGYVSYAIANPILPEFHDHFNSVVTDIATNYDVDGIHLDYIRYVPGTFNVNNFARMPHDPISHQMFADATGGLDGGDVENFEAYKTFLTDRITDLVASVKQNVDALEVSEGRAMELTASLFMEPSRAKNEYAQDWGRWVDEGLLDVAMPMIYISAQNDHLFEPYLASALSYKNPATGTRVAPNIASYLHMDPSRGGEVELTLEQIQIAHDLGADGVNFYDYPAFFNEYSAGDRAQIRDLLKNLAPPKAGPGDVIDDFEVNEGRFAWAYNSSPPSQTNGLSTATTIDRVTSEAQGGGASQELNLAASVPGGAWNLRHNSGLGGGMQANPLGNVPLTATGSVGLWIKTDDAGVTVQLAIDDPVAAGSSAIEKGTALQLIADNQWHLYQWDFENDDDWTPFGNAGSDGDIDATSGEVTIDSILFAGAGSAQLFLDTVSHNPFGKLTVTGDYNGDGTVDSDDLESWSEGVGTASNAAFDQGDGDADGDVDGADLLAWQRNLGVTTFTTPAVAAAGSVPEPGAAVLMVVAGLILAGARRVVDR